MSDPRPHDQSALTSLAAHIGRIAGVISSNDFPTGEQARLRRMSPSQPPALTFYRFAMRYLPEGWERDMPAWIAIVAGIALMAPNAHRPGARLGLTLADNGFAEMRLERLLSSRGETRLTLFLRAVRFIAAKSVPFDWTEGTRLLLTRDVNQLEQIHRQIASDYYRGLQAKTG